MANVEHRGTTASEVVGITAAEHAASVKALDARWDGVKRKLGLMLV